VSLIFIQITLDSSLFSSLFYFKKKYLFSFWVNKMFSFHFNWNKKFKIYKIFLGNFYIENYYYKTKFISYDLSGEEPMETMVAESAKGRWRLVFVVGRKAPTDMLALQCLSQYNQNYSETFSFVWSKLSLFKYYCRWPNCLFFYGVSSKD